MWTGAHPVSGHVTGGRWLSTPAPPDAMCPALQDAAREDIIREVISSPLLPRLLQDGYGNYVVQVRGCRAYQVAAGQRGGVSVDRWVGVPLRVGTRMHVRHMRLWLTFAFTSRFMLCDLARMLARQELASLKFWQQ
eukprot:1160230-Pelagomonas_calceolata.AAC.9